jgi:hypothetical protein
VIKSAEADLQYISIKIVGTGQSGYDFQHKIKLDVHKDDFQDLTGLGDAAVTTGNEITVLKGKYVVVYFWVVWL